MLLAACGRQGDRDQRASAEATTGAEGPRRAETTLATTDETQLRANATFEQTSDGVNVVLDVENAPPGKRGVHVHERGDCSDIAGKSMGAHFAPDHAEHGLPHEDARHLGDLGNIEIGEDGKGTLEIVAPRATLEPGDAKSFLGKALVVHAGEDKGTGPSGDSGDPVACGVIAAEDEAP